MVVPREESQGFEEWWNDIKMLTARYLVASEQMEKRGPVAAAIRGC
jgi:hypothetical protein